jgi:hypothetical protein
MRGGQQGVATVLALGLLIGGVYFLGWWTLLTFFVGLLAGARVFASALAQGRSPWENPWRDKK